MKIAYLPGLLVSVYISYTICSISTNPLSSAAYTMEVSDVSIYYSRFDLILLLDSISATVTAPM